MKQLFFIILVLLLCSSCSHHSDAAARHIFADTPVSLPIKPGIIDEASGIADSRTNPGYLWVEQDSGNPPELALLSYSGAVLRKMYLKGAINRDWEDMVLAPGPEAGVYYIYLADIGDNFQQYDSYNIYRFKEPASNTDTITGYEKIAFKYADGSNNAEAILVDPDTKDIFVVTKSDVKTNIYKLSYPQSTTTVTEATLVGSLPFSIVTGAGLSLDGKEIIIRTYPDLYYWKRNGTETIEQVLKREPIQLGYRLEIQGEAVGFRNDNSGFFTLSEKPAIASAVDLNFYKRN